ncbi:hypothetical protein VTO73DRAFT_12012 [Trametes versicolor]
MFARVLVASVLALPLFAAAQQNCPTGTLQCCDNLEPANSPAGTVILELMNVTLDNTNVDLGFGCTDLTTGGLATGACKTHAECCENSNVHGLVAVSCVPA